MKNRLLPLLAILIGQVACATTGQLQPSVSGTAATIPSTPVPQYSTTDVCDWFLQTQILRTRRQAGLTEFLGWYQEHAATGFDAVTISDSEELIGILQRYQPYQEEFVQAWTNLGPIPEGEKFWDNELASIQLRIQAFDNMIHGYETADLATIGRGIELFRQSQQVGLKGESAMMEVRSKCIN